MQPLGKTVWKFFKKSNSFHMTHVGNFTICELDAIKKVSVYLS